jgi:tRNA-dihydrouridine synthase A
METIQTRIEERKEEIGVAATEEEGMNQLMQNLKIASRKTTPRELFAIAPMVDVSDRHFRYFMRLLTKRSFLYTEMLNEHAIIYSKKGRYSMLSYSDNQHPLVCQIGGNNPEKMAQAAKLCEEWGYDEVNVNCGCPSSKTKDGCFGAVLMFDAELVARITRAMREAVNIPVTVKCRLGVDDVDRYEDVYHFINTVSSKGGVEKFIIHARKCLLEGLSPHENRTIPPLKYDWVFNLKRDFPQLRLVINGGFTELEGQIRDILRSG